VQGSENPHAAEEDNPREAQHGAVEPWGRDAATALARDLYQAVQSVAIWPNTNLYPSFDLQ